MLRELTILNTGVSKYKSKILPEISKIGGSAPKNNMEGKFYGMYRNHPANKHDERTEEKQSNITAFKKGRSQHTRDCENQLEAAEVENASLCPHRCSMHFSLTV